MNDEYYYTESIRLNKYNQLEYCNKDKFIQIKDSNWHHILSECGWEKINKQWIILLNRLSDKKKKNSLFGVMDCESDGDCFFHCIANSLNEKDRHIGNYYISSDIRKMISDNISKDQYDFMISTYRCMKDADDFSEGWDPYEVNSIEEFKQMIETSGHIYWGDYMLLQILGELLKINIYILNANEYENDYSIYNTMSEYKHEYDNIFLILENNCHFKLLGYFNEKMISYFKNDEIPIELKRLFKLDF
tara:strand:- start:1728 stop:2468 length:741 start_codon:yes stop_codon:yes gene_type:complete